MQSNAYSKNTTSKIVFSGTPSSSFGYITKFAISFQYFWTENLEIFIVFKTLHVPEILQLILTFSAPKVSNYCAW